MYIVIMLAVQISFLFVVAIDDLQANVTQGPWQTADEVMSIIIMIAYSFMYFGISNSVKRAFNAE